MSPAEVEDHVAIRGFLTAYARAVDTKDWVLYRSLFTPDAVIDYSSAGGETGDVETVASWLETTMALFEMTQHLIANEEISIEGDSATVRAMVHNPMKFVDGPLWSCGGWYNHELVRTDDGWKSRRLVEDLAWTTLGND